MKLISSPTYAIFSNRNEMFIKTIIFICQNEFFAWVKISIQSLLTKALEELIHRNVSFISVLWSGFIILRFATFFKDTNISCNEYVTLIALFPSISLTAVASISSVGKAYLT